LQGVLRSVRLSGEKTTAILSDSRCAFRKHRPTCSDSLQ
jgi:hypothetical protein